MIFLLISNLHKKKKRQRVTSHENEIERKREVEIIMGEQEKQDDVAKQAIYSVS